MGLFFGVYFVGEMPKQWISLFFGTHRIERVVNSEGEDVTCQFLTKCCYSVELVEGGEPRKPNDLRELNHIDEFKKGMRDAGIGYLEDASVFDALDAKRFKVIDFATKGCPL